MEINRIIDKLDEEEKRLYWNNTANDFFRNVYYSKEFAPILKKLNTNEKLTTSEWNYLVDRLFLVTCKAISEEDEVKYLDKILYILCKIGMKLSKEDGKIYNECVKMIEFIDSINKEKDINKDLLDGLDIVSDSKDDTDLDVLLRQHREASVFRDNQDSYYDAYKNSYKGFITDSERSYINCMSRSYIREKNLVNEYK